MWYTLSWPVRDPCLCKVVLCLKNQINCRIVWQSLISRNEKSLHETINEMRYPFRGQERYSHALSKELSHTSNFLVKNHIAICLNELENTIAKMKIATFMTALGNSILSALETQFQSLSLPFQVQGSILLYHQCISVHVEVLNTSFCILTSIKQKPMA